MDLNFFTPRALTGVINVRPVKYDLFAHFFREVAPRPVDVFELETSLRKAKILSSITNNGAGTMRDSEQLEVGYVVAPRFRPKRVFTAADLLKTQKGLTPYDPRFNPVERAIADDMDAHRDDIDHMVEIMCAQAAVDGKIELFDMIDGKIQATYCVDFNRPKEHEIKLTGDKAWNNAKSDLVGSIEDYNLMIQEDTGGLSATDLILGKDVWTAFRLHADVKDTLDNRRIDIGSLSPRVGAKLKGQWNGLNIWVHNATYQDIKCQRKYYIDPKCALLLARDAQSVIEFGQPVDIQCEGPVKIFAKQFEQADPSGIFTIAESRPLPVTRHIGWTVKLTVLPLEYVMAEFEIAYAPLKEYEGGYTNDPDDNGGETYAGIARNYFPNWPGWEKVDLYKRTVTRTPGALTQILAGLPDVQKQVADWYKAEWWDKLGLASMPQALANEIFEQSVNLGKSGCGKKLQTICNAYNYGPDKRPYFTDLKIDGAIGPKTLDALAILISKKTDGDSLVHALNCMQGAHYLELAAKKSSQRKYTVGWMKRTHCEE